MPPSASLAELARSFLDLWHHFDGVEARRFDREGPEPRLRPFDRVASRQYAAAVRSLEGAVLELELESLDDEIDRTVLLASIRPQARRHHRDHPERVDPTLWTGRLLSVLEARPGDGETLEMIPVWVDAARATVAGPPLAALPVALDDVAAARTALARSEWWRADQDALSWAAAALDRLERFLRLETMPDPEAGAGALGDDAVGWYLHHAGLIELGAGEAARRLRHRAETLRPQVDSLGKARAPTLDLRGAAEAYGQGLRHQESEIRRRLAAPAWLEAFALFVAVSGSGAAPDQPTEPATLWERIQLGRIDLATQVADPEAPTALPDSIPAGPAALRHPLEAAIVALLALEWQGQRTTWAGDTGSFVGAVVEHGVFHPVLAGWRLGLP